MKNEHLAWINPPLWIVVMLSIILLMLLGFLGYLGIKNNSSDQTKVETIEVYVQFQEIADDGVYSSLRKYTAENVIEQTSYILLYNARDEFGNQFEQVTIMNTPVIVERKSK